MLDRWPSGWQLIDGQLQERDDVADGQRRRVFFFDDGQSIVRIEKITPIGAQRLTALQWPAVLSLLIRSFQSAAITDSSSSSGVDDGGCSWAMIYCFGSAAV